ncbi:MAG TPA: hypothetical protein VHI32_13925 [Burkholderiales bacterium]|nr:hypothetical protein [Burkholderiales bacterium]
MEIEPQAKPALPLLGLLALASALGVAVAVVLAAVAMLLAAPAYADEGSLLLERHAGLAPATLLFAQNESKEEGHRRIVEAYANPFDEPLAGVYLFRLPQNAVLERLSFARGAGAPESALLTLRYGAAVVERTALIAPGETLRVELEYRARAPQERRLLTRCC